MAWVERRKRQDGRVRYAGIYRDPTGRKRSAGTFESKREAQRAAHDMENRLHRGVWIDPSDGRVTFEDFVEYQWLPSRQIEMTTRAGYRSALDQRLLPFFGRMEMRSVLPSTVQAWVTEMTGVISPRTICKYHAILNSIFRRAVRDRVIVTNPAVDTELPKVILKSLRILTPQEFERLIEEFEPRYALMLLVAIETGGRWGEIAALRPSDVDFLRRTVRLERVVIEVGKRVTGANTIATIRDYPKTNVGRTVRISQELVDVISQHTARSGLSRDGLLFSASGRPGSGPISRNTFRSRVWLPALKRARLGFHVRFHDLRHAHASWALAGGADLKAVMDRMGHSQITTTQRYLHTLPESDDRALAAFARIRTQSLP